MKQHTETIMRLADAYARATAQWLRSKEDVREYQRMADARRALVDYIAGLPTPPNAPPNATDGSGDVPRVAQQPALTDVQIDAVFDRWAGSNAFGAPYLRCYPEQFRSIARDLLAASTAGVLASSTSDREPS